MLGFIYQILLGTLITLKLAVCAALFGMVFGLVGAFLESINNKSLRFIAAGSIFIIRGIPEILVLFFIYFGMTALLSELFDHYIDIDTFTAGVVALGLIFGSYASLVFRGAFLAIDKGQREAAMAMGFSRWQIFLRIELPQAWRHAIPGIGNLWLVLLKDTAIVTLIGLSDLMNRAKIAASTTHQPFTFYLIAALIYLLITSFSQQIIDFFSTKVNRHIEA